MDRQTIRVNANFLILFKLPKKDLTHIYNDIVSFDEDTLKPNCDFPAFLELAKRVWDKKYEFMVIDKFNETYDQRYRKGFSTYYSQVMENYIPIRKSNKPLKMKCLNLNTSDLNETSFQGTDEK